MYTRIRYTLSLTTNGQCCIPPQRLQKTQSKQCIYADTERRVVGKNEYGLLFFRLVFFGNWYRFRIGVWVCRRLQLGVRCVTNAAFA